MRNVVYVLLGLTLTLLIAAVFAPLMIWVAAPILGLTLTLFIWHLCLYRPPEDHLGVIYQLGRFSRLVEPDEWAITIPGVHKPRTPISLHVRRLDADFPEVLTQDQVPVDCKLVVYFQRDLRCADAAVRTEALHIPDEGWNTIIRTVMRETIDEVVSCVPYHQLLTARGRADLKQALGVLVGRRVQRLGLIVHPRRGVSVQMLRPTQAVWQAMVEQSAAVSLGEAALARVRPMLQELSQLHPEISWEALLLEWAAVMAKEGTTPQVLVASGQEPTAFLAGKARGQPEARSGPARDRPGVNGNRGKRKTNLVEYLPKVKERANP